MIETDVERIPNHGTDQYFFNDVLKDGIRFLVQNVHHELEMEKPSERYHDRIDVVLEQPSVRFFCGLDTLMP